VYIVSSNGTQWEAAMTMSDELGKLAQLHADGKLTDEEFARAKERLLNGEQPAAAEPVVSAVN